MQIRRVRNIHAMNMIMLFRNLYLVIPTDIYSFLQCAGICRWRVRVRVWCRQCICILSRQGRQGWYENIYGMARVSYELPQLAWNRCRRHWCGAESCRKTKNHGAGYLCHESVETLAHHSGHEWVNFWNRIYPAQRHCWLNAATTTGGGIRTDHAGVGRV